MSIEVIRPGMLSIIQDEGRTGYRKYGVPSGGVMDTFAARTANMLVGNPREAAVLEMTLSGPELRFRETQLIALCGADMSAMVDGKPVPLWRPVVIRQDSVLRIGSCRSGMRGYIAFAGGVEVPRTMSSRSTDLKTGFGGLDGRPLRAGDRLFTREGSRAAHALLHVMAKRAKEQGEGMAATSWRLSEYEIPGYRADPVLRVMPGKDHGEFAEESLHQFYRDRYMVTSESDRMGYRLKGAALELARKADRLSEAVAYGTVQVPPDGQPIVLMADHQTVGGYPVIAQIARVDLPLLAQARPGSRVAFARVSHEEAQQLLLHQEKSMRQAEMWIRRKMSEMGNER